MGRKNTACQTCRSIKTLCTKEVPCARCKRLSLPCKYENTDNAEPQLLATSSKTTTKTKHRKSATGCLSCRRRRKKCDERQPICGDCERLHLTCSMPEDHGGSESPIEDRRLLVTDELFTSDAFQLWAANDANQDQEPAARLESFSDWLTLIETDNYADVKRTAPLANSTALVDLGQVDNDSDLGLATFLPSTALNNLTGVTPQTLESWTIGERHLLNHFLQSVSRALSIAEDKANPFLLVVVPMALENTMVRHSLVSLSACHLARVYPDFEHDLCVHRGKAVRELMHQLETHEASIFALAATLILCLTEICIGSSRIWLLHLHGARGLLDRSHGHFIDSPLESLIEMYNYLCCIASITSVNAPRKFGLQLQLSSNSERTEPDVIHPLFGISTDLYESLERINMLITRCEQNWTAFSGVEAEQLELALQSWSPPDVVAESRYFIEARAIGFAMQWASIMLLLQATRRLPNDDPQITKASDNILSALSLIRPGSEMEAHMLFPLFMAGVGSMTKANRLTVEYRLSVMETTIGFGNVAIAHKILDEIWQQANQGHILNWKELISESYQGFVLL